MALWIIRSCSLRSPGKPVGVALHWRSCAGVMAECATVFPHRPQLPAVPDLVRSALSPCFG